MVKKLEKILKGYLRRPPKEDSKEEWKETNPTRIKEEKWRNLLKKVIIPRKRRINNGPGMEELGNGRDPRRFAK